MKEQWDAASQSTINNQSRITRNLKQIEQKAANLIDLIIDAGSSSLAPANKKRLKELEAEKAVLTEKLDNFDHPTEDFKEIYRTAIQFMSNPLNL